MAWEQRKGTTKVYYFEARREGPKVLKIYRGSSSTAQAAALRVEKMRAERSLAVRTALELGARTHPAEVLLDELFEAVLNLAAATLFAAGYWRPSRHEWRKWREGVRELRAAG